MGKEVFKALINDPLLASVPKILETPYAPEDLHEVAEDLNIMRNLSV
jgi:endonuclease IV